MNVFLPKSNHSNNVKFIHTQLLLIISIGKLMAINLVLLHNLTTKSPPEFDPLVLSETVLPFPLKFLGAMNH